MIPDMELCPLCSFSPPSLQSTEKAKSFLIIGWEDGWPQGKGCWYLLCPYSYHDLVAIFPLRKGQAYCNVLEACGGDIWMFHFSVLLFWKYDTKTCSVRNKIKKNCGGISSLK
jgi:hypothetical protein